MALEANAAILILFYRAEYSRCIMDKHVIIDVSYRCGVFWVFFVGVVGCFFFKDCLKKKLSNRYGNGCKFLSFCVIDTDGNIFDHMMENSVAAKATF